MGSVVWELKFRLMVRLVVQIGGYFRFDSMGCRGTRFEAGASRCWVRG